MIALLLMCAVIAQDPITNPMLARKQAAYKEWAKAVRETAESKNKGAEKVLRGKEAKIRAKYGVSPNQLTFTLKQGLMEKWPTEQPKDRLCVQAILDPLILQDEIREWDVEHDPNYGTARIMDGGKDFIDYVQASAGRSRDIPVAPITLCKTKKPDGQPCNRKTVGKPNRNCYEHRG